MLFSLNNLTQIGTGTQSDNIKVSTQEAVPARGLHSYIIHTYPPLNFHLFAPEYYQL